jgi:hypothetical protein
MKFHRYLELSRYLLPLALTIIVQELGGQFLNGGMARVPQATATLASFGLAWGLVSLPLSALLQVKQLSLVLVDSRPSFARVSAFVWLSGLLAGLLVVSFTFGPSSVWLIEGLHGIEPGLSGAVREILFWFIPIPLLRALTLFYAGLLLQIRRTDLASYATVAGLVASILTVFGFLPAGFVQANPIWLPIIVTYAGVLVELAILLWGQWRFIGPSLAEAGSDLSLGYIVRFFWPLAFIMIIQGVSRPLINLFVSAGPDGPEALAVLTVVYALALLPYGWLNEIRNLAISFKGDADSLPYIRRFAAGCGLLSLAMMLVMFWLPPLRVYILRNLIGLEPALAAKAVVPLLIFSLFPLVVTIRGYWHGIGLLERRTKALAPSAPARLAAIWLSLVILQNFQLAGASLGVTALLAGFTAEALAVWWGVQGRPSFRNRKKGGELAKAPR